MPTPGRPYLPGQGLPGQIIPGFTPTIIPPTPTPTPAPVLVSSPLTPPPQQFTTAQTFINQQSNIVQVLIFLRRQSSGGPQAALPGQGLPGQVLPGFNIPFRQHGFMLVEGKDYTRNKGLVTLLIPPPGPSDRLTAVIFQKGLQLGGATPARYVAPWQLPLPLEGPYDGLGNLYAVVFGPTINGSLDGVNKVFQTSVQMPRWQIFRNGILQTLNVDVYAPGGNTFAFATGAVPQPGDILTAMGYPS